MSPGQHLELIQEAKEWLLDLGAPPMLAPFIAAAWAAGETVRVMRRGKAFLVSAASPDD